MKKLLTLCFLLFVSVFGLYSQSDASASYTFYMNKAGRSALLFSGEMATKYSFEYEGSYFAYGDEFEKGIIEYNGNYYYDIYLNLNSHLDKVYVKNDPKTQPISLTSELVNFFMLGDKKFVRLTAEHENGLPSTGFYEVVCEREGETLYKRTVQIFECRLENLKAIYYFEKQQRYYLLKDGVYTRIKKKKILAKYLQEGGK